MFSTIRLDRSDGVLTITLNRPAHRNALDLAMRQELGQAIVEARDDPDVAALVLTGAGRAFCSGGDIRSQIASPRSLFASRTRLRSVDLWLRDLLGFPKPVVAAVDGAASGGGFPLAMAADIVLATDEAVFGATFGRIGLVPDMSTLYLLPRSIGMQRAKDVLFSARPISAREALRLGIVHRLCDRESLLDEASATARNLASGPWGHLYAIVKESLNNSFERQTL